MLSIDFDKIRPHFGGTLTQPQVDGINNIIAAYNKWGDDNPQELAYELATTRWETGHSMQPVKETQSARDKTPPSDAAVIRRLDAAFKAGKLPWVKTPYWKAGWFGRGYVQLTHEFNYKGPARAAVLREFAVDIYENRDAVMRLDIAAFILVVGMKEGWFTTKAIGQFIDDLDEEDALELLEFVAGRVVINGKDKAKEIAQLALQFEDAIIRIAKTSSIPTSPVGGSGPIIPKKSLIQAIIDFFLDLLPKPKRR